MTFFVKKMIPVLLLGSISGLLIGLLGAGGGIPLVIGLRHLFGKKVANGKSFYSTTLATMLPLSLYSAYQYAKSTPLADAFPLSAALASVLGGAVGALLLSRLSARGLRLIFAAVLLISGIFMVT